MKILDQKIDKYRRISLPEDMVPNVLKANKDMLEGDETVMT